MSQVCQCQKYGGGDPVGHDLDKPLTDWLAHIRDHLHRASLSGARSMDQREHLVKAGGLVLSAIWSADVNAERVSPENANMAISGSDCPLCGNESETALDNLVHPPANPGPVIALIEAAMNVDARFLSEAMRPRAGLGDLNMAQSAYRTWLAQQGGEGRT